MIIQPPTKLCPEGITLQGPAADILPSSFVMMIVGGPGSGKSHLISQLLTRSDFFSGRFDRIFYFGPTEYEGIELDEDNQCSTVSEEQVSQIVQSMKQEDSADYNVLFVFDDVIATLYANRSKPWLGNLFFNRRHILGKGTLSILYTTQKFTSAPTQLRVATNIMFVPKVNQAQIKAITRQMNISLPTILVSNQILRLPRYGFLCANLETGDLYNDKFIKL